LIGDGPARSGQGRCPIPSAHRATPASDSECGERFPERELWQSRFGSNGAAQHYDAGRIAGFAVRRHSWRCATRKTSGRMEMQGSRTKKRAPRNRRSNDNSAHRAAVCENGGMGRLVKGNAFYLTGEEVTTQPLLYRACGLEGIYLLNGYHVETHDNEEYVAISDIDGLHKTIGRHIVLHRKALAPKEVRFLRNTLDLTQAEIAEMLGVNSQSVARWEKGEHEIPGAAERLLRVIFLASLLTEEELAKVINDLMQRLKVLNELDDTGVTPAQFQLFGEWSQKLAA